MQQFISVEDSTCSVHASRGPLEPASPQLRSEVAIVTGIAEATLGDRYGIDWRAMRDDYRRDPTAHRAGGPGLRGLRGQRSTGRAASCCRTRRATPGRSPPPRAGPSSRCPRSRCCRCRPGHLVLQTLRSHDQFNTTIYGLSDRYRGIEGGRRVIFVNPDDLAEPWASPTASTVDLDRATGPTTTGTAASHGFRIVAYDTPRGCAAAYYPETNPLVPLDSTAEGSNTPTSKSVIVSLVPAGTAARRRIRPSPRDDPTRWTRPAPTTITRATRSRSTSPDRDR